MCPHVMEEGGGALWGLFYKDTNPIHEGSALKPKAPPSKYHHTWGLGFNIQILGGHKHSVCTKEQ